MLCRGGEERGKRKFWRLQSSEADMGGKRNELQIFPSSPELLELRYGSLKRSSTMQ